MSAKATTNKAKIAKDAKSSDKNLSLHQLSINAIKALKAESKNLSRAVDLLLTSEAPEVKAWTVNFERDEIFRLIKTQPAREKWSPWAVMMTVNKAARLEAKAKK